MLLSVYSYSCSAQFEHVQSTVTQRPQLTIFSWTLTLYNLLPAFLNVWFKTLVKKVTFSSLSILMACENSNNSNINQMSIGCGKKPQSCFHPRTLNIYKMPLQSINNFGMNINQVAMVGIFLVNICGKFNSWKPCGDNMFGLECKLYSVASLHRSSCWAQCGGNHSHPMLQRRVTKCVCFPVHNGTWAVTKNMT